MNGRDPDLVRITLHSSIVGDQPLSGVVFHSVAKAAIFGCPSGVFDNFVRLRL
jgi:hypothetical protein